MIFSPNTTHFKIKFLFVKKQHETINKNLPSSKLPLNIAFNNKKMLGKIKKDKEGAIFTVINHFVKSHYSNSNNIEEKY